MQSPSNSCCTKSLNEDHWVISLTRTIYWCCKNNQKSAVEYTLALSNMRTGVSWTEKLFLYIVFRYITRRRWGTHRSAQGALELRPNSIWTVEDAPGAHLNCAWCNVPSRSLTQYHIRSVEHARLRRIWSVKDEPRAHLNCTWGAHLICLACDQAHLNCAWGAHLIS